MLILGLEPNLNSGIWRWNNEEKRKRRKILNKENKHINKYILFIILCEFVHLDWMWNSQSNLNSNVDSKSKNKNKRKRKRKVNAAWADFPLAGPPADFREALSTCAQRQLPSGPIVQSPDASLPRGAHWTDLSSSASLDKSSAVLAEPLPRFGLIRPRVRIGANQFPTTKTPVGRVSRETLIWATIKGDRDLPCGFTAQRTQPPWAKLAGMKNSTAYRGRKSLRLGHRCTAMYSAAQSGWQHLLIAAHGKLSFPVLRLQGVVAAAIDYHRR
jgi:hypothetical protein